MQISSIQKVYRNTETGEILKLKCSKCGEEVLPGYTIHAETKFEQDIINEAFGTEEKKYWELCMDCAKDYLVFK